jgi:hypothetical protein
VQDPEEAAARHHAEAAITLHHPDYVLPLAGLRTLLQTVVR